jgi:hypothetical protein
VRLAAERHRAVPAAATLDEHLGAVVQHQE